MKDIVILGGPNGAGKTTAARVLLPNEMQVREFVNAHGIAQGLSPFNVDGVALTAGRIMIERIRTLVRSEEDFAFETTCAGRQHAVWLNDCKRNGWRITLLFLWLSSAEMAVARVAKRIGEGGHATPPHVIRRRYSSGVHNMLRIYLPLADDATVYDNSDGELTLIAERFESGDVVVRDRERWIRLEEAGK